MQSLLQILGRVSNLLLYFLCLKIFMSIKVKTKSKINRKQLQLTLHYDTLRIDASNIHKMFQYYNNYLYRRKHFVHCIFVYGGIKK